MSCRGHNNTKPSCSTFSTHSLCSFGDDCSKPVLARQQQGRESLFSSATREVLSSSPLTWYPWDGDLPATATFSSLSKWLYLDDIILISGEGKLHRGGVGFHDVGAAVSILFVQHLRTNGESQVKSQAPQP